ncbi:MAG: SigB/SigF/SigG family RNA polymerase sigma factor [Bacilli bacterium]
MARHKVEICGVNTANIKILKNEEMIELFKKKSKGDEEAKNILINGNLKLVLSILKKYNNRCDNLDDLFQVGCVGLIKAIDNFDLSHEVRFSTYAVPMITGEIKRYLRDNNPLRISRSIKDIAYKTLKLKEQLMDINGNYPTNAEIADILGVSEYDIISALESLKDPISMYEPIYNDGGDTIYLFDQIAAKTDDYELDTKISLDKALNSLKKRERYILDQRYIIGKTQMEIALELGISQAQISRIEKNAITHIKKKVK